MRDAFEIGNRSIESAAISQAALHVGPAADGRIKPDISVLGKIISGGLPGGAVVGLN